MAAIERISKMNRAPLLAASLFALLLSGCLADASPDGQGSATEPGGSTDNGANPSGGSTDPGGSGSNPGTTTGGTSGGGSTSPGSSRVIGYFAAWSVYARDYHVNE